MVDLYSGFTNQSTLCNMDRITTTGLSIVIIARNEAKNIARAIESVFRAVQGWPHVEILLVDSASTDATVGIAKRYPISIVRLDPSWFLSVAAGRYIGMIYSREELILHMDGDMELDPEWVKRAVAYALDHPEVAAIGGYWRNIYGRDGHWVREEDQLRDHQARILEVEFVGGASLYRRSAVEQVGGFQPYIRGEEEVILCIAMHHAGYKIVRLPYLMSKHYCVPPKSLAGNLRRLRSDMWIGYGQVPRYYWGTSVFWTYLYKRGTFIAPLTTLVLTLAILLLSAFSGNFALFGIWMGLGGLVFMAYAVKKRSFQQAIMSGLERMMVSYSAVRGFLMHPKMHTEYPTNVEIIQIQSHLSLPI